MPSLLVRSLIRRNSIEEEYLYVCTDRTKFFGPMIFAEMRLVCRMLNFDDWVDEFVPEHRDLVDRNAYARLAWSEVEKAWKVRSLVVTDHAGEALVVFSGASVMLNKKGEHKLYKTHNAIENDVHRLLQPETGDSVDCNVLIMTSTKLPAKDAS